jgi:transcriptional regulator with XRE-family HTH domain
LERWRTIKEETLKSSGQIPTGADVKRVRESRGLSVTDFAVLLGVTRQTVYAWERAVDSAMKFGPPALVVLLLMEELRGTISNVYAALVSFAKKRGQLTSFHEEPLERDARSSSRSRLSAPRPAGAPRFAALDPAA